MDNCGNNCPNHGNRGNGFLIVLVIYILLAIILGSHNNCCYF